MGGVLRFSDPKNQDGGVFDLQLRKSKTTPSTIFGAEDSFFGSEDRRPPLIFDLLSRRSKNPPCSIFGPEHRRTPPSSPFGREEWVEDQTEEAGGVGLFRRWGGSSKMGPMAIFDPIFSSENRRWGRVLRSSASKIEDGRGFFDLRTRRTIMGGSSIFGSEDRRWGGLRSSVPKREDGGSSIFDSEDRMLKMGGFYDVRLRKPKVGGPSKMGGSSKKRLLRRRGDSSKKRGASNISLFRLW